MRIFRNDLNIRNELNIYLSVEKAEIVESAISGEIESLLGADLDKWNYPIFRASELFGQSLLSRTALSIFQVSRFELFIIY